MIEEEKKENYSIITLNNGKVNAINTGLVTALKNKFTELQNDDSNKGVILSGKPNAFSAGLDVKMLATNTQQQAYNFWLTYMQALQIMVTYNKPFVCAITGFAPAGATILALCADYRIMAKGTKHVMGMNEFNMSLPVPEMLNDIYGHYLGEHKAWAAIQNASVYNSDECLALGLVNQSVEAEEVLPKAEKHLKKLLNVIPMVYSETKQYNRKGLHKIVNRDLEKLANEVIAFYKSPQLGNMIKMFAANFS